MQEEYGGLTEQQFENLFRSIFERPGKIKKMWYQKSFLNLLEKGIQPLRLVHVLRDQNEPTTALLVKACKNSKEELNSLVTDPILEKIMFVLSITKSSKESLPTLHNTFLQLLWRHVTFQGKHLNGWSSQNSTALFAKALTSLKGLDSVTEALNALNIQ